MAYAPYYNTPGMTAPPIVGYFEVPGLSGGFEYSERPRDDRGGVWPAYPLRIFTLDGDRAALIKKTVAYVVIDEAPDGAPVVEKWPIHHHRIYAK